MVKNINYIKMNANSNQILIYYVQNIPIFFFIFNIMAVDFISYL